MASLKVKATEHGAVPRELQDVDSACWHDPRAFSTWCAREKLDEPAAVRTWAERFMAGLRLWAKANDVSGIHDLERLKDLKIPFVGSLERHKARIELDNG